jgi:hypothetical protein
MHGVYCINATEEPNLEGLKLRSIFMDKITIMNSRASSFICDDLRSRREKREHKREYGATIQYLVDAGFVNIFGGFIDRDDLDYPRCRRASFANLLPHFALDYIKGKGAEHPFEFFRDIDPVLAELLYLMRIGFNGVEVDGRSWAKLNLFVDDEAIFLDGAVYLTFLGSVCARLKANKLREDGERAVTLLPLLPLFSYEEAAGEIINATVKEIPTPARDIPWQDLISLKSDEEFQHRVRLFRQWTTRILKDGISNETLADEIKTAIFEYEKYMNSIHVKYEKTTFEWAVSLPVHMIEDILKLRAGKLIDRIFDIKKAKAVLSVEEMKAPSRELSIVPKLKEKLPYLRRGASD